MSLVSFSVVSVFVALIGVCESSSCSIHCDILKSYKDNISCSDRMLGDGSSLPWKCNQVIGRCETIKTRHLESEVNCSFVEEECNITLANCESMWFTGLVCENLSRIDCNGYHASVIRNNESIFLNITRQNLPSTSTALSTPPFQTSEKTPPETMPDIDPTSVTSVVSSLTACVTNRDNSSNSDGSVPASVIALVCSLGTCAYLIASKLYKKHKKSRREYTDHGSELDANQGRSLDIVHLPPPLPTPLPTGSVNGANVNLPPMVERVNLSQTLTQVPRLSLESSFNSSTREPSISLPFGAIAESSKELDTFSLDHRGKQWDFKEGHGEIHKAENKPGNDNENIYCTMEDLTAKALNAPLKNINTAENMSVLATPTVVDCTYILEELPGCSKGGAISGYPAGDSIPANEPEKKTFQRNVRFIPEEEDDYVSYRDMGCTIYANMPLPRLGSPKRPALNLTTPSLPPPKEFIEDSEKQSEANNTNISESKML